MLGRISCSFMLNARLLLRNYMRSCILQLYDLVKYNYIPTLVKNQSLSIGSS